MKKSALILIICVFVLSCTHTPEIPGLDYVKWKEDDYGCIGYRNDAANIIIRNDDKLKGMAERDIYKTLGKADKNMLRERNRKSYIYYLEGHPSCSKKTDVALRFLLIQFNAVNKVTEVTIQTLGKEGSQLDNNPEI